MKVGEFKFVFLIDLVLPVVSASVFLCIEVISYDLTVLFSIRVCA